MGKEQERLTDRYFHWLVNLVDMDDSEYEPLMRFLFTYTFIWILDKDENRACDGLDLRVRFLDEIGAKPDTQVHRGACSVLEMLVAFCIRIDHDIFGEEDENGAGAWFWEFIGNLDLDRFDGKLGPKDVTQIDDILEKWLGRKFGRNGSGSICPINKSGQSGLRDQRKREIWYQFADYVRVNGED